MGTQLIFVLETDRRCQSDWMYINNLIHKQYDYDHSYIKLSPIFLGGRGNYNKKKVERDIDCNFRQNGAGILIQAVQ